MQRLISTHVEASKIGRQIAEEVLDSQRRGGDSSSDSSPSPEAERALPVMQPTTAEVKSYVHSSLLYLHFDHFEP